MYLFHYKVRTRSPYFWDDVRDKLTSRDIPFLMTERPDRTGAVWSRELVGLSSSMRAADSVIAAARNRSVGSLYEELESSIDRLPNEGYVAVFGLTRLRKEKQPLLSLRKLREAGFENINLLSDSRTEEVLATATDITKIRAFLRRLASPHRELSPLIRGTERSYFVLNISESRPEILGIGES